MTPGIALVTGAGARLGRAMALALAEDGWTVAVHYLSSKEGAEETCTMIRKAGGRAEPVLADLSDETARADLVVRAAHATGGPVSLLINSASAFDDDDFASHTREDWDRHIEPNLRAPIHLAQQLAAGLPAGTPGLVLNLIDQRVWKLNPLFFTYTLSKAALWQAT